LHGNENKTKSQEPGLQKRYVTVTVYRNEADSNTFD
jgi:hypothetical protein